MPRLLLVDDNPSIHRIAESLLAPTDVDLVCVDSAAEALDRIARGERFDVALVDTAMPGMDGWTLLSRLRAMDETAHMPIALMAGVLDPVDPAKLAKAPIQGFLKKPIELRELGDRVKALLNTPVILSPSPFSTMPATPAKDLVKRAEAVLPEFRPGAAEAAAGIMEFDLALPATSHPLPETEDDLLVLTAEDLWPEETAPILPDTDLPIPVLSDVHLELEELDLESLQDLTEEPLPQALPEAMPEAEPAPEPAAFLPEEEDLVTLSGLEDLDLLPAEFELPEPVPAPLPEPVIEPEDFLADLPLADTLIGVAGFTVISGHAEQAPAQEDRDPILSAMEPFRMPESVTSEPELPSTEPAAPGQPPAAPGQGTSLPAVPTPESLEPAPEPSASAPDALEPAPVPSEQAQALVHALLADPVLMDALVKALVARMGDQVLREIAWEVMPDLAERLHQ